MCRWIHGRPRLTEAEKTGLAARQIIERAVVGNAWANNMCDRILARNGYQGSSMLTNESRRRVDVVYKRACELVHGFYHPLGTELELVAWKSDIAWLRRVLRWSPDEPLLTESQILAASARQMIEHVVRRNTAQEPMRTCIFDRNWFHGECRPPRPLCNELWSIYMEACSFVHGNRDNRISCWRKKIDDMMHIAYWINWRLECTEQDDANSCQW